MRKRVVCLLLVCCMLVAILPGVALGTEMFTITFVDGRYPEHPPEYQTARVAIGATLGDALAQIEEPSREGWYFTGWYSSWALSYVVETTIVGTDHTRRLYASWSKSPMIWMGFSCGDHIFHQNVQAEIGLPYKAVLERVLEPQKAGHIFAGWAHWCGRVLSASDIVTPTSARGFQAHWEPIDASALTDVPPGAWFEDAVEFVISNQVMTGTSLTTFAPNEAICRSMLVASLFWMGRGGFSHPEENVFVDVDARQWIFQPIRWAWNREIVNGVSENRFAPHASVTREQLAVMLYRYEQRVMSWWDEENEEWTGQYTPVPNDFCLSTQFTDYADVSEWALDAMRWAVYHGLLRGTSPTSLAPRGTVTRAQTAVILMRYMQSISW